MTGALIVTVLDAVFIVALLVSPLGAELVALVLDDRDFYQPIHRRKTVTAEPEHIPVDVVQTTCPMCGEHIFDAVLRHTIDGAVLASPDVQTEARRRIAEHEKTCPGNH